MRFRLGRQRATVITRVRGQHNQRADGSSVAHEGCLLRPTPIGSGGEQMAQGRDQQEQRWRLHAPVGFTAAPASVVTVEPGPVDEQGNPLRLDVAGPVEGHWNLDGVETHRTVALRLITS